MKKYLLILFTLLFSVFHILADNPDRAKMKEDIQKFKIDFLAQEMSLSEKEKADFAPVYKDYDNELRKSGSEAYRFEQELSKKNDATEEDYQKLSQLQKKSRENFDKITTKYHAKFEKILTAKQIFLMHKGEEKFFNKMKEMRKKHGKHGSDRPSPGKKGGKPDSRPGDWFQPTEP